MHLELEAESARRAAALREDRGEPAPCGREWCCEHTKQAYPRRPITKSGSHPSGAAGKFTADCLPDTWVHKAKMVVVAPPCNVRGESTQARGSPGPRSRPYCRGRLRRPEHSIQHCERNAQLLTWIGCRGSPSRVATQFAMICETAGFKDAPTAPN